MPKRLVRGRLVRGRLVRGLVTGLAGVLGAAFVGLAGAGGWLYWNRVEQRCEQAARAELPVLAKRQVTDVLTYDYQTVERTINEAGRNLTPDYRREFEQKAQQQIIPQARDNQVVSQASVVGVGVMDAHRDSASVMVYVNQTWNDKSRKPVYDGSRLRVDYQRVAGKWLISYITPI